MTDGSSAPAVPRGISCPRRHQLWFRHSFQRHSECLKRGADILVHHLSRLCPPQATPWRTTPASQMVARQMGRPNQRHQSGLPVRRLYVFFLPRGAFHRRPKLGGRLQLGNRHFRRDVSPRASLLHLRGPEEVCGSCELGEAGLNDPGARGGLVSKIHAPYSGWGCPHISRTEPPCCALRDLIWVVCVHRIAQLSRRREAICIYAMDLFMGP